MTFLDSVRQVLHVFWLFIPLPVFWALYDQQVHYNCALIQLIDIIQQCDEYRTDMSSLLTVN